MVNLKTKYKHLYTSVDCTVITCNHGPCETIVGSQCRYKHPLVVVYKIDNENGE